MLGFQGLLSLQELENIPVEVMGKRIRTRMMTPCRLPWLKLVTKFSSAVKRQLTRQKSAKTGKWSQYLQKLQNPLHPNVYKI